MVKKKTYHDEEGHFTSKENDGGPCHHEGDHKEYRVGTTDGDTFEGTIKAKSPEEAERLAQQRYPGHGDELTIDAFDDDYDEEFEDFHKSYEEVFTDNDTKQIEKYAEHYGVDAGELKDRIHQNALDKMRQGDSVTNAKNDAMEEVLDEVANGDFDQHVEWDKEYEKDDAMYFDNEKQLDTYNKLWDELEFAGNDEIEGTLQYKVQEAFENGEINEDHYNKLFDIIQEKLLDDSEPEQKNWYDDLEDNEYTREYRDRAMKVDPERAKLITDAMNEYVKENPTRGFINADQVKRYSERLGLGGLSDDELGQMWYDTDDVAGLYEHGKPYDKGGRELSDARSAFIELINSEARNRRGGKTKEDALARIRSFADEIGKYDADDTRGYLNGEQSDFINNAVRKHGITKSELRELNPRVFGPGGYSQYGVEDEDLSEFDDEVQILDKAGFKTTNKRISQLSDKERNQLYKDVMFIHYNPGVGEDMRRNRIRSILEGTYKK